MICHEDSTSAKLLQRTRRFSYFEHFAEARLSCIWLRWHGARVCKLNDADKRVNIVHLFDGLIVEFLFCAFVIMSDEFTHHFVKPLQVFGKA